MTAPLRIRVLTPEALDGKASNLVGTIGSQLRSAILSLNGASDPGVTFTSAATANAGMKRDAAGRAQVVAPSATLDIANKTYVDTAIGGKVNTTSLGAASGVATLDGTTKLTAAQVPTYLSQNLGTGTALPGSPRQGDVYRHTGLGCLLVYSGTEWRQLTLATVATRAARTTLTTTYSAILHPGFEVLQADKKLRWKMCDDGVWGYAGFSGGSVFGNTDNTAPVVAYRRENLSVASTAGAGRVVVTGWALHSPTNAGLTARDWLTYSNGTFLLQDRCNVSVTALANSIRDAGGRSTLRLIPPGGTNAIFGGAVEDTRTRGTGFSGAGSVDQSVTWAGPANQLSDFSIDVSQLNSAAEAVNYTFSISATILPLM